MVREVYAPAGPPPFAPKDATSIDVLEWVQRIREESPPNVFYSNEALLYWCRSFWDFNSAEYKMAKEIINQLPLPEVQSEES